MYLNSSEERTSCRKYILNKIYLNRAYFTQIAHEIKEYMEKKITKRAFADKISTIQDEYINKNNTYDTTFYNEIFGTRQHDEPKTDHLFVIFGLDHIFLGPITYNQLKICFINSIVTTTWKSSSTEILVAHTLQDDYKFVSNYYVNLLKDIVLNQQKRLNPELYIKYHKEIEGSVKKLFEAKNVERSPQPPPQQQQYQPPPPQQQQYRTRPPQYRTSSLPRPPHSLKNRQPPKRTFEDFLRKTQEKTRKANWANKAWYEAQEQPQWGGQEQPQWGGQRQGNAGREWQEQPQGHGQTEQSQPEKIYTGEDMEECRAIKATPQPPVCWSKKIQFDYHPDKNLGCVERAKDLFQKYQNLKLPEKLPEKGCY